MGKEEGERVKDQFQVIVTFEKHDHGLALKAVTGPREACAIVDEAMRILAQYKILEARQSYNKQKGLIHPLRPRGIGI
jgi:hypothetical protein